MHVETKFLRLFRAVELGHDIDGWRVCWLGGWDKGRVLFVVMVERVADMPGPPTPIAPEELPSKSKPSPAKKPPITTTKKASRDGTKTKAFLPA
jgi:hypothetical protein